MKLKTLPQSFFKEPTVRVARELLGKFLIRRVGGKTVRVMITEVEVYDGLRDRGSHARCGKTVRNAVMFGPPGYWYVYFTYGMHWMLNVVCREKGYPAAILLRSARAVENGQKINGPARLTKFLGVDGRFNGKPAAKRSGLWMEDGGIHPPQFSGGKPWRVKKSRRIGIAYAGKYWASRKLRFFVQYAV